MQRTDELELLYLQMFSLRNFSSVKDRVMDRLRQDTAETAVQAGQMAN